MAARSIDVFPAWFSSGTKIAWASDRHNRGNLDVYTMNADGSGVTQLTNSPGEDRGNSWTSDDEKIVFHSARDRDQSHTFDVWVMDADGSNQEKLFVNGSAAYVCGDSETGRIVFNSNRTGAFEISTMNIDGSDVQQVTHTGDFNSGPKWSPDCSTISYNRLDDGNSLDVFRIDADGSNRVNLTNSPGTFEAFSAWSPDGERIVFSSNRDVNFELYTMDSDDGGDVEHLTFTDLGEADFRADWGTSPAHSNPFHRSHCKDGTWAEFTSPSFSNQGEWVSHVEQATAVPQ